MDDLTKMILSIKANEWLKLNPERLNAKEKERFLKDFQEFLSGKSKIVADEVFDFLVSFGFTKDLPREKEFANHLNKKYSFVKFKNVLDVGAGRLCKLSRELTRLGFQTTAIDPNIRISASEAKAFKLKAVKTSKFFCDEFAKNGRGFDVSSFDLIVGLEPCDATEHIVRQSLKYDKPFDVLLCAAPHDALSGENFKTYEEWYDHLRKISSEIEISKKGSSYFATNVEREF